MNFGMTSDTSKAVITAIYCAVLYSSGRLSPLPLQQIPLTWMDRFIPFWPAMLVAYFLLFPLLIITYVATEKSSRSRFLLLAATMQTLAAIVFFAFPTRYQREPWIKEIASQQTDVFSSFLLHFWQHIDPPGNCFPSLHVSSALLCGYFLISKTPASSRWRQPTAKVVTIFSTVLICVSTVSVRQHFSYDILAGAALFAMVAFTDGKLRKDIN